MTSNEQILIDIVRDYQDLNPSFVEEVSGEPTAIEFSRFVQRNRPAVFRGLGHDLNVPALHKWTRKYLRDVLGDAELSIAATPEGNADGLVGEVFVEPAYMNMKMAEFLDRIEEQRPNEVLYLQSQNDNLHSELQKLLEDATSDIPFATQVFGAPPDVANVWIGDDRSVTSLHKDPYENMYLVIQGTKTFHLLPPTEFYCLHESLYTTGTYERTDIGNWNIKMSENVLPWIPVDPAKPVDLDKYPRYKSARPLSVTLQRGDILYLPALWYHRVSQTASKDPEVPLAIAINWWYDLAFDSPVWTLSNCIRKMTLALDGRTDPS